MLIGLIIGGIIVTLVIILCLCGYVKAPPDMAYIISGPHKTRILTGRAGIKIPFLERLDKLSLGAIIIDVKTSSFVPTKEFIGVKVDGAVTVQVGQSEEMINLAAKNFLNTKPEIIGEKVNSLLEGNMREIIGGMRLEDMVKDRKAFSEKVQENAVPDLARYGLELVTFNVQNFTDEGDVIANLGIDNVAQISKNAAIAKSVAKKEVEIAEAANAKEANDAKVAAAEAIARQNAELEIKKAQLKKDTDTKAAEAKAATGIEEENQRKVREVAATNANIARAEREAELKQKQIQLKEYELDALVRKQADADKYAAEQQAAADLIRRQREAEAKAYELQKAAEAKKIQADAERYAAEQQAAGIAAVGAAEAEAIEKKAEAQKKMEGASILDMYFNALPEVVANATKPFEKIDSITMYGSENTKQLLGEVMQNTNQIQNAIKEATGLDIVKLISDRWQNKQE